MIRLTKAEKTLLEFISTTTMGLIYIQDGSKDQVTAWRLQCKDLLKRHLTYFSGGISYWSLTSAGWEKAKILK